MRIILSLCALLLSVSAFSQRYAGFRISMYAALANPVGDFASTDNTVNGTRGYAELGLDVGMSGELFFTPRVSAIIRGGIGFYNVNEEELAKAYTAGFEAGATVTATPYQNIYAIIGPSYNLPLIKDKLGVQPYVLGGLGIFRTSEKDALITDDISMQTRVKNTPEIEAGFLYTPGVAFNYAVLPFAEVRLFAEYMGAQYKVTETITTESFVDRSFQSRAQTYQLEVFNFGASFNVRF